jgi:hypothetical protein
VQFLVFIGNITDAVLDGLLPDHRYFQQDDGAKYQTNQLFERKCILVGKPGSGKSTLSHFIGYQAWKRYTPYGYSTNVVESTDLDVLLYEGIGKFDVNVLILQDVTKASFKSSSVQHLHKIRQLVENSTGNLNGLVLIVVETHIFHGIQKDIRSNFDAVIYLSLPNNPYDRTVCKSYVGEDGMKMLASWEPGKVRVEERKKCVAYYYGLVGKFEMEPPPQIIWRAL